VAALTVGVKLYDAASDGTRGTTLGFLAGLPNIFALVRRKEDTLPLPSRRDELLRLAVLVPATTIGLGVAAVVFGAGTWWSSQPFALEHAAKVLTFCFVLTPLANTSSVAWRLAGGRGLDFMDHPIAARTPADFWRRYNRPVAQFFWEDVFKPSGGLHTPRRSLLAAFAVSAAVHEYLFLIAGTTAPGCQTAFFLIQGVAAAATCRLHPRGRRAVVAIAMTFSFNLATTALFFMSFEGIVPFYAPRGGLVMFPPTWSPP
jgi:hypothetical protein